MATYKVIQDIEADDKLVGPFGIRQFIYLLIVAALMFVAFRLSQAAWFLALPFLPPIIFFGLLAMPIGGGQPTEVWLLAKLRFLIKPRKRLWDQNGIRELVTITAPKKEDRHLTKELSQIEVKSRLQTLANTLDSHGWAIKHLGSDPFAQAATATGTAASDRLVDVSMQSQPATYDVVAENDMLDEQNNPTAQKLGQMIDASSKSRREQIISKMKQPPAPSAPAEPPTPGGTVTPSSSITPPPGTPTSSDDNLTEEELLNKIHAEKAKPKNYGHMRVIKPIEEQQAEAAAKARQAAAEAANKPPAAPPVTQPPDPGIIELAHNDDLNVETIARQAGKKQPKKRPPKGEVVINLHDD